MRSGRMSVDIPVYDLSLIRKLWEGRVKKYRQRQKKEEERISKSALTKLNVEWQYRIACRKLKSSEVETLQCYLERSTLTQLDILPNNINKDDKEEDKKFIFELTGNKWMKLPEDLQYMTYLKEWHIRGTRIPEIPTYIEMFVDLRVLDVPKNGLTKLPAEIGKLTSLRELNVSYNKLLSIPAELGDCENLERLEMTANINLTELPFELSHLKKLQYLDMSENQFATIPICVLRMENLTFLDISNNRLKDLPEDIDRSVSHEIIIIQTQRMNKNHVKICSCFRIEALETVFLHRNKIKYIPMSMSNITHLKMLVLSADELISIPSRFVDNPDIKLIRLYDNPLKTEDDEEHVSEINTDEHEKEFMKMYLQSLEERETQPTYTTKVSLNCLL
nr:leucine-rich repeat-containing protein 2 isoform X1 [Misgurnus anguillicaudatus]